MYTFFGHTQDTTGETPTGRLGERAVEDLEDRVHGCFVVDLVEDEREAVLHDTGELDEVAPVADELRAILDRGQEGSVRNGLCDCWV
jgi:hypothetical protein